MAVDEQRSVQEPHAFFDVHQAYTLAVPRIGVETSALVANPHFKLVRLPRKAYVGSGAARVLRDVHHAFLKHTVQAHGSLFGRIFVGS